MTTKAERRGVRVLAHLLAWGAISLAFTLSPAAATEAKNEDKTFMERMQEWQDKMSETFRDAWKNLRLDDKGGSVSTASVDLREQKDSYIVRLNLPGRDLEKVRITVSDGALHIAAPAEDKAGSYEQTLKLDGIASNAEPKIKRKQKDAMIVVTVPKNGSVAKSSPDPTVSDPPLLPVGDWDRDFLARMEKMRRDMDRVFEDAFDEFKLAPEYKGFFDEPRFGSSVDLKDDGDHYTVRAYLPERSMNNVNVTVEQQSLRIEAKEQEFKARRGKSQDLRRERKAAYSQILTLPGPVQAEKMKVEKKDQMLVVTLPKAK
jgi:HSP20 family molecular chaperone IbpA